MKERGRSRSTGGIYKSVFSSQDAKGARKNASPQTGEAKPSNSLSIDQEMPPGDEQQNATKHTLLYIALNPKSHSQLARWYQKAITFVILCDAIVYVLSTEPNLSHLSHVFYSTEAITSTVFAIEYFARLLVCTEKRCYAKHGPTRGRWKYMLSSQALIDAFATFPFFIELVSGIPLPTLTYLRVFRVLRITRTRSYSQAMDAVGRVLYFNREILYVAGLLGMYLVVVTSILMYYLRPRGKDAELVDDPTDFQSIAKTMVLSTLMLTGQGGPSGNLPWYTQLVVLLTGIFSIGMFAIPASMLTWGFEAEAERLGAKAKKRVLAKRRGEVYVSDTSSSSSSSSACSGFGDISTSDEEYLAIIGGDDGDADKDGAPVMNAPLGHGELVSLVSRVESLEQKIELVDSKLDMILSMLDGR